MRYFERPRVMIVCALLDKIRPSASRARVASSSFMQCDFLPPAVVLVA